ncbi:MAG: hypothetical protein ABI693_27870 [Bryobacteraceae bacterium]
MEPAVEEHLLLCHLCQDRLAELDAFRQGLAAAQQLVETRPDISVRLRHRLAGLLAYRPIWIAATAMAALLFVVAPLFRSAGRPVEVALSALRAGEVAVTYAPSDRNLQLRLDAEGLPENIGLTVQIVDASGGTILRTSATATASYALVSLPKGLARGHYWLRLASEPDSPAPLREFSLDVR